MFKRLHVFLSMWLIAAACSVHAAEAQDAPTVEVYLPHLCLACMDWADHLRQNGFKVVLKETDDMPALKRRLKVTNSRGPVSGNSKGVSP